MVEIKSVKVSGDGWLLNNTMSVPGNAPGNKEYEMIKQWLEEGNTPEPEFTEEELAQQAKDKQIAEAKAYLSSTRRFLNEGISEQTIGSLIAIISNKAMLNPSYSDGKTPN